MDFNIRPALKEYNDAQLRMHYSRSTIKQYTGWYVRYLKWSGSYEAMKKAGENHVNDYLSDLAHQTVNLHQAVNALKFYYQKVIFRPDFRIGGYNVREKVLNCLLYYLFKK